MYCPRLRITPLGPGPCFIIVYPPKMKPMHSPTVPPIMAPIFTVRVSGGAPLSGVVGRGCGLLLSKVLGAWPWRPAEGTEDTGGIVVWSVVVGLSAVWYRRCCCCGCVSGEGEGWSAGAGGAAAVLVGWWGASGKASVGCGIRAEMEARRRKIP